MAPPCAYCIAASSNHHRDVAVSGTSTEHNGLNIIAHHRNGGSYRIPVIVGSCEYSHQWLGESASIYVVYLPQPVLVYIHTALDVTE